MHALCHGSWLGSLAYAWKGPAAADSTKGICIAANGARRHVKAACRSIPESKRKVRFQSRQACHTSLLIMQNAPIPACGTVTMAKTRRVHKPWLAGVDSPSGAEVPCELPSMDGENGINQSGDTGAFQCCMARGGAHLPCVSNTG